MKSLPLILIAALLAGCAASADQINVISTDWDRCIAAAVIRMDDGKTDPVSMAYGIAPQCAVQYNALTEAEASQMLTQNSQLYMRGRMADGEVQMVTAAVLAHRKATHR